MIAKIACAAAVAIALTASPAAAKSKPGACSDDGIAKADAAVMKMPDGDNKTAAMQEMTSAKASMTQKDLAGCATHMSKAMKMRAMKGKKK
jgi:phosphopantothenate synthetase